MVYKAIKNKFRVKSLRIVYLLYWFFLAYILSALVFWFIALNKQNSQLIYYKTQMIDANDIHLAGKKRALEKEKQNKKVQYIGEGVTFFLLIVAGAVVVFRIIRRQLVQSQQQYHFMMAITHELKTPIAVTKLNLETLQMRQLTAVQQQKLIQSTIQEASRLNALCNNMLLMSQIDSGGYIITSERTDLAAMAADCVEDFKARFPQREIELVAETEAWVNGDKLLLQLAINNLVDNAIKYSGKEAPIMVKVFVNDKKVFLQVIDEGKGIAEKEKDEIFVKYFRSAQMQTKGTGLGLYLTKEIVKQHRGYIRMTNNIPHGCIFEMEFHHATL